LSAAPVSTAPSPQSPPVERSLIRLLDHDQELARHFDAAELPKASAALTVAARRAPAGPWAPPAERPEGLIGFLVIEGIVLRETEIAGRGCAHLIGPGDIVDPWMQSEVNACGTATYRVVEDAVLAILNTRFVQNAAPWPQVLPAMVERLVRQSEQIGALYALALLPRVDTRLIAFFWQLAQRWGRVGSDGVIIPLDLTHRTLGELVGGRRPTISVALTELEQAGHLRRRQAGGWALSRDSWKLLADTPCPIDPSPVLGGPAA
jgi:CRP-like cAMP-binding protein